MKTLLVTGYRAHELGIFDNKHQGIPYIKKALANRLKPLIEEGVEWVITPGQYGVDLWACEVVSELKTQYPELKLGIITAHTGQEEKWKEEKQNEYRRIIAGADFLAQSVMLLMTAAGSFGPGMICCSAKVTEYCSFMMRMRRREVRSFLKSGR